MHITLLISILLPMIVGVGFIYVFLERSKKAHHLRKNGLRAEGTIFEFSDGASTVKTASDNLLFPVIRFATQSGEWITREYTLTHSSLRQGDKMTVYYDSTDPHDFYVEMGGRASLPAFLVIGIAATGFGLYKLIDYLLQ